MTKPVHYQSAGSGLRFECLRFEWSAWLSSRRDTRLEIPGQGYEYRHVVDDDAPPKPRTSTDLRVVTCDTCCRSIASMMKEKLS